MIRKINAVTTSQDNCVLGGYISRLMPSPEACRCKTLKPELVLLHLSREGNLPPKRALDCEPSTMRKILLQVFGLGNRREATSDTKPESENRPFVAILTRLRNILDILEISNMEIKGIFGDFEKFRWFRWLQKNAYFQSCNHCYHLLLYIKELVVVYIYSYRKSCKPVFRWNRWYQSVLGAAISLSLAIIAPADAAPPPAGSEDAEMMAPMHDWINSARNPQGWLCCSEADARPVDVRTRGDHYEVRFMHPDELPDPKPVGWQTVPADAIMRDEHGRAIPAPEGVPVAWWYNGVVRCFAVPGGV